MQGFPFQALCEGFELIVTGLNNHTACKVCSTELVSSIQPPRLVHACDGVRAGWPSSKIAGGTALQYKVEIGGIRCTYV